MSKKKKSPKKSDSQSRQIIAQLKAENRKLKKQNELQQAVLGTIEEVNEILAEDQSGKEMLWTKKFPHNLSPEVAEKIQESLKKTAKSEDTKVLLDKLLPVTDSE